MAGLNVSACIISSGTIARGNPERAIELSGSVFQGKILSLMFVSSFQSVKFEVIKAYKGKRQKIIRAKNFHTSCDTFLPFEDIGKSYLVFLRKDSVGSYRLYALLPLDYLDRIESVFVEKHSVLMNVAPLAPDTKTTVRF